MKIAVHEPPGMFRIRAIQRPLLTQGKLWFTQTFDGVFQLHAGVFDEGAKELLVWDSRTIRPRITRKHIGWRYHHRNPLLDEEVWERVVRVPFLVKQ